MDGRGNRLLSVDVFAGRTFSTDSGPGRIEAVGIGVPWARLSGVKAVVWSAPWARVPASCAGRASSLSWMLSWATAHAYR
jgi:hypothetical protein